MKTAKGFSLGIALAGLWEILAPFVIGYSSVTGGMVNAVINEFEGLALLITIPGTALMKQKI